MPGRIRPIAFLSPMGGPSMGTTINSSLDRSNFISRSWEIFTDISQIRGSVRRMTQLRRSRQLSSSSFHLNTARKNRNTGTVGLLIASMRFPQKLTLPKWTQYILNLQLLVFGKTSSFSARLHIAFVWGDSDRMCCFGDSFVGGGVKADPPFASAPMRDVGGVRIFSTKL